MIIENRKAYHDYFIDETLECGISLRGNEVKSIRKGACSLRESWCSIQDGNLILRGMHISRYETANMFDIDEDRERQLLAHKKEISRLADLVKVVGVTLVPLRLYFKGNRCKVLIGVCRGKHNYDKRNTLKERQVRRDIDRAMRNK